MEKSRYHIATMISVASFSLIMLLNNPAYSQLSYPIVDTDQSTYFNNSRSIAAPQSGAAFGGQDAQYYGHQPSYTDNGDGTVTDNVTGLMWQQSFDQNGDGSIDVADKLSYDDLVSLVNGGLSFAGYSDWRLPTIKEQYSLILFSGRDISGYNGSSTQGLIPFIDDVTFEFGYGDTNAGERLIDMQCATSTVYVDGSVEELVFGVNFADGRIKGYGTSLRGQDKLFNYLLVRGSTSYGINNFQDNNDGTITDHATGLMWMENDNGEGVLWENALSQAEQYEFGGYSDWRLPNAKELQSILDYTRSPSTTNSGAIDPLFNCSQITNEDGVADYAYYWTSTTHGNWTSGNNGASAIYLSFGRALGYDQMGPQPGWRDVHGAGAQRSDPKVGDPDDYPMGRGPQGDAIRIYNYVRLVRDFQVSTSLDHGEDHHGQIHIFPNPTKDEIFISSDSEISSVGIYNLTGQKILERFPGERVTKLNIGFLLNGYYLVKTTTSNNKISVQKVIVER